MSINMTTVKKIMHNNKEVSKIEDLNGNILWQKPNVEKQITITYLMGFYTGQTPVSKTVTTTGGVYALTSSDLPTLTLATGYYTDGWTLNGSTKLTAGTQISDNVTLKAIHKVTVTKTYSWTAGKSSGRVYYRDTGTASCSHNTTLWNLSTGATGTYTNTYSKSWTCSLSSLDGTYVKVGVRGFNGQIVTFQIYKNRPFKIKWSPSVTSVTYTVTSGWTSDTFYPNTYPMILVRDGNTTTKLYTNGNVAANTTTSTITPSSSNNAYITLQYGGWDASGNGKTSWGRQYVVGASNTTLSYPTSNQSGNVTDNIYVYMQ